MPDDLEMTDDVMSDEELRALRATPPEIVVGNHVFHLLELAAIHLSAEPAQFEQAQLIIDAVSGLLRAVGDRLGENGPLLNEGLTQIQLAFVRITSAQGNG